MGKEEQRNTSHNKIRNERGKIIIIASNAGGSNK
jgi:hypothetical protein